MAKPFSLLLFLLFVSSSAAYADEKIHVINNMGKDICEFYISAHNENDWGDDILEELDECLHHNKNVHVIWPETMDSSLNYDLRIVFRDGSDWVIENQRVKRKDNGEIGFTFNN